MEVEAQRKLIQAPMLALLRLEVVARLTHMFSARRITGLLFKNKPAVIQLNKPPTKFDHNQ